jgi:hypothetical protein
LTHFIIHTTSSAANPTDIDLPLISVAEPCYRSTAKEKLEFPTMSTTARRRLMRDFKVRGIAAEHSLRFHDFSQAAIHLHCAKRLPFQRADPFEQRMQTDPPAGVSASPIADNVMTWYG